MRKTHVTRLVEINMEHTLYLGFQWVKWQNISYFNRMIQHDMRYA